jgi:hypothetical protein
MVTEAVDEHGPEMTSSVPLSVEVGDGVEVSCALIGDPVLSSTYLLTNHNGEFISTQHPQEAPLSPHPLPPPSSVDASDKMVYLWLTSYPLDTASYIYKEAGYMVYDMPHDEIPSFLLRTTADFKSIVPQLYQQFPDTDVSYGVTATLPPSLSLSSGQAGLTAVAEISVRVEESGQLLSAFSLTVSLQCGIELSIETRPSGQFIAGEVTSFTTEIVNVNTNIGEFDSAQFQDLLHTVIKFLAVPNINRLLRPGQSLPSHEGVTATNTVISVAEGYILVGTDISI